MKNDSVISVDAVQVGQLLRGVAIPDPTACLVERPVPEAKLVILVLELRVVEENDLGRGFVVLHQALPGRLLRPEKRKTPKHFYVWSGPQQLALGPYVRTCISKSLWTSSSLGWEMIPLGWPAKKGEIFFI